MNERIFYGTHPEQFGDLHQPDTHLNAAVGPLVILIHGGFWRDQYHLDLMEPLALNLADRGYATFNIEYRRVGPTGGGFPTTLDDIAAAVDLVSTQDWSHIAIIGHSAGGHLALWNASRTDAARRPDLTVGLAPVADVIAANRTGVGRDATANFFGGDVDDVPERYDAGQPQPAEFGGRIVVIHGDGDDNVPVAQALAIEAHTHRLELLADVDHFDVINPDHFSWEIVLEELRTLQDPAPAAPTSC